MEMMNAAGYEIEVSSTSIELRLNGGKCLPWNSMFFRIRPIIEEPKTIGTTRPACSDGRVLVAPVCESFAPNDFDILVRNSGVGCVVPQRDEPIVLTLLTIRRSAGYDDETATSSKRISRDPLRDLAFQSRWLAGRPSLELPASTGGSKPIIWDLGLPRPSIAPIVFGLIFSVDSD